MLASEKRKSQKDKSMLKQIGSLFTPSLFLGMFALSVPGASLADERIGVSCADFAKYSGAYSIENTTGVTIYYSYGVGGHSGDRGNTDDTKRPGARDYTAQPPWSSLGLPHVAGCRIAVIREPSRVAPSISADATLPVGFPNSSLAAPA